MRVFSGLGRVQNPQGQTAGIGLEVNIITQSLLFTFTNKSTNEKAVFSSSQVCLYVR